MTVRLLRACFLLLSATAISLTPLHSQEQAAAPLGESTRSPHETNAPTGEDGADGEREDSQGSTEQLAPESGRRARPPSLTLNPYEAGTELLILLNTGEWLKGRLEYLNYGRLYINSRKMDKVNFDWEDVYYLHSNTEFECTFRNDQKIRGLVEIDREWLTITLLGGEEETYPREALLSMYPGERGLGKTRWYGRVSASYQDAKGNTEELLWDLSMDLTGRAGSLSNRVWGSSSFSEQDGERVRDRHEYLSQLTYDLTHLWHLNLLRTEALFDKFQNIDFRGRVGAGPGYSPLRNNRGNLWIDAGVQYEYTEFESATTDGNTRQDSAGVFYGIHFDYELTSKIDLLLDTNSFTSFDNSDDTTHSIRGTISFEIVSDFDLDFSVDWDRVENPQRGDDGVLPDRDDVRVLIGLAWEF